MLYLLSDIEKINFNRTEKELQFFVLFAVAVAGKRAKSIIKALNKFFQISEFFNCTADLPFDIIKLLIKNDKLLAAIKESGLGQHTKLFKSFAQLANSNFNLKICSLEELEQIHGISFKTSRFFICFNRDERKYAILDRHILAELKDIGYANIPKQTPQNKKQYEQIEQVFLEYAKLLNKKPSELDLKIWKQRSNY